jgi:hypothetical protein
LKNAEKGCRVKIDLKKVKTALVDRAKRVGYALRGWLNAVMQKPLLKAPPVELQDDAAASVLTVDGTRAVVPAARKRVRPIRRRGREKVYRLKGYTTVAKVNRRRQSERQQRFLRRVMVIIIVVLILVLLFNLYNPFRDLHEWYRIIGIHDISEITEKTTVKPTPSATTKTTTAEGTTTTSQKASQATTKK